MNETLANLAHEVEAALALDDALADRVQEALTDATGAGIERAALDRTDDVLALVSECRTGWSVSMEGVARQPNGHWTCALRQSASRDDDEYLGVGRGPTLPHALLAALLKALAYTG
jgi:hypothetical protein